VTESIIELRQNQLSKTNELIKKIKKLRSILEADTNEARNIDRLLVKLYNLRDGLCKHISELHQYNTISEKMKIL